MHSAKDIDIEKQLRGLAGQRFGIEPETISSEMRLSALGDSLDFVDFLSDIEREFNLALDNDRLAEVVTVEDLWAVVRDALVLAAAPPTA